ncbi:MAG: class I SAM-dependent methyltransferase [Acidobacteriota bacterium]
MASLKGIVSRRYYELNSWVGQWPFTKANLNGFMHEAGFDLTGLTLNAGRGEVDYRLDAEREITIDIDSSLSPEVVADLHSIPLQSETITTVVAICVLEHVARPWDVVREFHRILKANGKLIVEVPFINPMHAAPHDFFRFSIEGLSVVLTDNGFRVVDKRITQPASYGVLWLWWKRLKEIRFYPLRFTSLLGLKTLSWFLGLRNQQMEIVRGSDYSQFLVAAEKI